MKRMKSAASGTMVLSLFFSLVGLFVFTQPAKATSCEQHRIIERHYGWNDANGNPVCASMCWACSVFEVVVGEEITECDGTVTSWGLTNCTYHVDTIIQNCDCEEPPPQ